MPHDATEQQHIVRNHDLERLIACLKTPSARRSLAGIRNMISITREMGGWNGARLCLHDMLGEATASGVDVAVMLTLCVGIACELTATIDAGEAAAAKGGAL